MASTEISRGKTTNIDLHLRHPMPSIELVQRRPSPSCIEDEDHQRLSLNSPLTSSP
jgi:hypothetical protein